MLTAPAARWRIRQAWGQRVSVRHSYRLTRARARLPTTVRKLLRGAGDSHHRTSCSPAGRWTRWRPSPGGLAHEINNPLFQASRQLLAPASARATSGELSAGVASGPGNEARATRPREAATHEGVMFQRLVRVSTARILHTVDLMRRCSREGYSASPATDLFRAARTWSGSLPRPPGEGHHAPSRRRRRPLRPRGDAPAPHQPRAERHRCPRRRHRPRRGGRAKPASRRSPSPSRDSSPGVKPEDHGRIFAPSFCDRRPRARVTLGMGLTIARVARRPDPQRHRTSPRRPRWGQGRDASSCACRPPIRASRPRLSARCRPPREGFSTALPHH